MEVDLSRALLWIVLLPMVGAVVNGLVGRFASRQSVTTVGVGSVAVAFALALASFFKVVGQDGQPLSLEAYEWFTLTLGTSEVPVRVAFVMDSLSGVMTLVVTGIGLLIHVYSTGYMKDDPGYARFFAYLNLFMASMLILVLASNLPLMFVGWEGVGLCSYLLIGFWWKNTEFAKAGRKAFIMNRIGDFGVLIGMFMLVSAVGSFEFVEINRAAGRLATMPWFLGPTQIATVATVATLFLFLGCTGKSAQIPLFTWLPDAMAGPTPVSALIHAATMVTAGVYLCCRLSHLFIASSTTMAVIALIGAFTALLAASIALVQNHMKRILAYSTVSQLGFMFAAVGSGAFAAGIFHVYTHAFFKACLFLGAGSVMHAVGEHKDADIRKLGGMGKFMPYTKWTFLLSCLAIAGVPLFSGFFSKDMILLGAYRAAAVGYFAAPWVGYTVFTVLFVAAVMTAFYMFRLYFRVFSGEYRSAPARSVMEAEGDEGEGAAHAEHVESHAEHAEHADAHGHDDHPYDPHPHESPPSMTIPLGVLGFGAVVAGWVNLEPLNYFHSEALRDRWGSWLEDRVADLSRVTSLSGMEEATHTAHTAAGVMGFLAMLVGVGVAAALYRNKATDVLPARMPRGLHQILLDKWRVDELYDAVVVRPIAFVARVSGWIDKVFVDGLLTKVTSVSVRVLGWLFTRLQTGVIYVYGAVLVVGLAATAWWFLQPQVRAEHEVEGSAVTWRVAPGLGYEFRWDLESDGTFDTDWSASRTDVKETYSDPEHWTGHVLFVVPEGVTDAPREVVLEEGKAKILDEDWLGDPATWRRDEADQPPSVTLEDDQLIVRLNAASLVTEGKRVTEELALRIGEGTRIGLVQLQHGVTVEATVEARNAFGNRASRHLEAAIRPPEQEAVVAEAGR